MISKRLRYFLPITAKFSIAGLFIPGFTVMPIIGLQMGLQSLGIECTITWNILWLVSFVGVIILPVYFYKGMITRLLDGTDTSTSSIILFNLGEYTLIQLALSYFITRSKTLCYASDGQNGIELVFTGWLSIPVLLLLSLLFDSKRKEIIHP